jgi:3-oxoadipate enol-lactonase
MHTGHLAQNHPEHTNISHTLYYQDLGHGDPLVMIHGYMVSGGMFQPVIETMAQENRLLIQDMRGSGENLNHKGPYTVMQHAEDIRTMLDDLKIEKAHILGYSMGGIVAQQFAILYPERVRSLILCCTFEHKPTTALERMERPIVQTIVQRLGAAGIARFIIPEVAEAALGMDPAVIEWYRKTVLNNRDEVLLTAAHELFKFDSRPYLPKLKMPTLVIGATADLITPVHHTEALTRLLPNSYSKVFEGAGHVLIISHAKEFASTVRHFLNIVKRDERTGIAGDPRKKAIQRMAS